ncbi:cache domain-containing protein [Pseudonocardia kujensis]|uniref:cache domain-containing protein n=1 Tax=Pseudonocardia kujensis TaxID=1128675 RepID=UPI001E61AB8A|nr:cache domain-containing protein [Pseudonocardia kujensis]MCE0761618.1 cache domain-containing protein [Pseudonocardia kujensis]
MSAAPEPAAVPDPADALAARVEQLCATAFGALDALRRVAEQLFLPWAAGTPVRAEEVAAIAGAVRPIVEPEGTPLVGAGLVLAPDVLADAAHWMEWWYRSGAGPRKLLPVLDPEAENFFDYTSFPWFAVPRDTGARHVTGPYVDWLCTEEYTLTFTVPLYATHHERGRTYLGVVGADVVTSWLERRLLPLLHRMTGPTALVNAEGRVLVANRPDLVTGAVTRQADVPALWRRSDPALRRLEDTPLAILALA